MVSIELIQIPDFGQSQQNPTYSHFREPVPHRSATDNGARLDIAMYGFWGDRFEKAFWMRGCSTQVLN